MSRLPNGGKNGGNISFGQFLELRQFRFCISFFSFVFSISYFFILSFGISFLPFSSFCYFFFWLCFFWLHAANPFSLSLPVANVHCNCNIKPHCCKKKKKTKEKTREAPKCGSGWLLVCGLWLDPLASPTSKLTALLRSPEISNHLYFYYSFPYVHVGSTLQVHVI